MWMFLLSAVAGADPIADVVALREKLAPTSCPAGMALIGLAGTESAACIETTRRPGLEWMPAMQVCAAEGRQVCTANQWYLGSQSGLTTGQCDGTREWAGSRIHGNGDGHLMTIVGNDTGDCRYQTWEWSGFKDRYAGAIAFRCCLGGLSSLFE